MISLGEKSELGFISSATVEIIASSPRNLQVCSLSFTTEWVVPLLSFYMPSISGV
jgi:hypothetical protein